MISQYGYVLTHTKCEKNTFISKMLCVDTQWIRGCDHMSFLGLWMIRCTLFFSNAIEISTVQHFEHQHNISHENLQARNQCDNDT